jgi:hypothetical protein
MEYRITEEEMMGLWRAGSGKSRSVLNWWSSVVLAVCDTQPCLWRVLLLSSRSVVVGLGMTIPL